MSKTVVGFFSELNQAEKLVRDLKTLGLGGDKINIVGRDPWAGQGPGFEQVHSRPDSARGGALLGGAAGFLAGVLTLAVPGVGPVVVAGPLFAGLVGSAAGAAAGAITGALKQKGIPEDEAEQYAEGVKDGGAVVLVTVEEDRVDDVARAMQDDGAVDIDTRVPRKPSSPAALPYDPDQPTLRQRRLSRTVRAYGVR